MKKFLLFFSLLCCLSAEVMAQPATYAMPFSIGRNNCGSNAGATTLYRFPSGTRTYNYDSTYFFDYVSPNLSRNTLRAAYLPRLRVGASTYTNGGVPYRDRFSISAASVSFNPKDGKLYYLWTDYNSDVSATLKTYVWRWNPDTTFSTAAFTPVPAAALLVDTLCSFVFDIGGITFDNQGNAWQLEFSNAPAPYKSRMRKIDFVTKVIDPIPDTLDLVGAVGGIGDTIYNVGSGDITLMPNGQMYYVFDNKLYTPDYGSYGAPGRHINSTYIDTIRRPTGATNLVGLAYGNGDLISSFSPGCLYRRIDPISGDTNFVNYTYVASKGVQSTDMSQISSGLGLAKRLVSVTSAGPVGVYNVVYDIVVKNYGTTPITNLQVYDSLRNINGVGNVSSVTTTMLTIPPPPGIALNGGFNGTTDSRLLQFTGQNLPNYPVDSSSFTIRVNCRIAGVLSGVVYNNSAVGYATGYKGVALRDSSTNGSVPDLNQNDKPDDVSEGIPTPFVIAVDPINSACGSLSSILYTENFGTGAIGGSGLLATMPTSPNTTSSTYTGTTTAPIATNRFAIITNANTANTTDFLSFTDHTGGANGRMMVVNGDAPPRIIFRDTLPTACAGRQYSFSFWAAFPYSASYQSFCGALGGFRYPKFKVQFRDQTTGLITVADTTTNITLNSWTQFGYRWTMPASATGLIVELVNDAPGGCGNDFVIDDIVFGTCDPLPLVNSNASPACLGDSIRFVGTLTDSTAIPGTKDHQWQVAPTAGGPWVNIIGATLPYYVINPVLASDTGKYYRIIVAPQGSIALPLCQAISPGVLLSGRKPSTAPSSITAPSTTYCNPGSATLTAVGGILGTSANYQWGTGAVVGTSPIAGATGISLVVSPTVTTTYWVQIQNTSSPCASATGGVTVVVTVNQPSVAPSGITGPDICNGSSTTLTANGGTLGTGANYQWGTGAVVGTSPIAGATSSTLTVSPSSTTTYWVRIQNTTAPCTAITSGVTKVVTVNQPSTGPSSISAPSTTICNGSSVLLTSVGGTLGTSANYQWGTGGVIGTSPIAGATSSTLTVSPATTTTYWVQIQNTASPCTAATGGVTLTVTVNQPSVAPSGITGPDICNGSSTTLTANGGTLGTGSNYQWGTGAVVGTSPIAGATSSTLTVSPSSTTTYWVRIQNTTAPCTAATGGVTKVVTVTQPSTAPSGISGPDICNGSSTTLTATGGALGTSANYQWGTGAVVGTSPIAGATSSTLTVSPSSTTTYWVQIQNTASPCTAATGGVTKVVTVTQPSVAPSGISGPDICNGASTTLTATGGALGTSANYQWGTGAVVGASPIAGATSSTLTVSPSSTTTYWVQIQNTASPCTAATGGVTKVVTVTQPSVAPSGISGPDICNGASTTLTATGGTLGTSANYQWGTGAVVGTSPIAGATSSTLTVSPSSTTTYWVQIQNTASPCTAATGGVTKVVTVTQPSTAPSSISGPDICNGSSTTLTATGGTLGTSANYQWGTGAVVGTSPIAGATSSTLTVSPSSTTTYWVRIQNTAAPCTAATGGVTKVVTVTQPSVAPSGISGPDVCNGGSTTLTATGGTLGTSANYQWGTGAVVGTSPIAGATSSTLTVSPGSTTTYWVQIQNTASPCTAATGGVTKVVTVTQPSTAPSGISGPDICNGSSTTLTATGGALGTSANYQWGTGAVVGASPIAGATSSTLTVSPSSTTTYWVQIQNTASPCTAATGGVTKVVTVTQPSVAPSGISGPDICNGASTTLTATGGTLGTSANYQWGTGAVVGTSPIAGATSSTLTVSPSSTTTYWVQIQNTASPCTAATGGVTKVVTVTQPSTAPSSISGPDICNGSSTTLTATGGTLGTSANYQWGTGAVVGTSPIAGATSSTLTVSPSSTTTYWVRIQNTAAPCTAATGGVTKVVTVTQPSVAPSGISGPDVCNGGSTTLTATGGTLGTSANYQWGTGAVVGTSPIAGATSSTLTVSPSGTTTYWVRIQNTASPCTATTSGVTKVVTVNQGSAAPSSVTGPDICNGSSTTLTAIGGTLGTSANYQWGTGAVVGASPIAGATSSTLTVSPIITTTYWVRIENTAGPCTPTTSGVTKVITVNQPSVAATAAGRNKNNICPGISAKIFRTGGTLGAGASWRWYTGSPGGTLIGSGDTLTVTPLVNTTYYVRAEGLCNTTPAEAITINISCDIDKDRDGIPDYIESNIAAAVANGYNTGYAGYVDYNNDFINDNFQADGDSDNDGIPNYQDATYPGRIDSNSDGIDDRFDIDLDGVINMLDLDSDNDGITDVAEAYGVDANGDGRLDNFTDTDGDGLSQNVDPNSTGANNSGVGLGLVNLDGDVVPNFLDLDSDNDGIPDIVEVGSSDTNNNGKVDGFVDVNGDGLHDGYINGTALLLTGTDGNADGRADTWPNKNLDRDLRPNAYDMDSDGDGIVDVIEAGLPDANLNGIVDGVIGSDGWSTTVSAMPALNLRSTDADAKPDYLDIDADDDGIPDNIEGQATASYKLPTLTDADGDGLMLPYDNTPAAFGGSGILVYDHDADNTPDYRDLDTDADGLPDRVEGNDFNLNAIPDDNVTLTGLDTDGDGLDNRFDSLNSVTNIKGTSFMMGVNGSFTGDATPGSRTTVQRSFTYQTDRDWRFSGYVLPVQFVKLTGQLQSNKVPLSWTVIASTLVDHFEVERSIDNRNFIQTGTVTQLVKLNEQQTFSFTDDVTSVTKDVIYYRIKVVGKAGEIQYSNILIIRKQQNKPSLTITPNPANDYVAIGLYAEKESDITIRLIDESGKTVLLQNKKVSKGSNTLQLTGLTKYSGGTYMLQVFMNENVITQKLVLMH